MAMQAISTYSTTVSGVDPDLRIKVSKGEGEAKENLGGFDVNPRKNLLFQKKKLDLDIEEGTQVNVEVEGNEGCFMVQTILR